MHLTEATHNGKKIVTNGDWHGPHEWCAHFDGEEELGGYGYGRTEAEAIADFISNLDD